MRDLTIYRLERAQEYLTAAKCTLNREHCKFVVVAAFFAIFNAVRALLAEEQYEPKTFLAIIRHFRYEYIKTGVFEDKYFNYIGEAFRARQYSDYGDFVVVSREQAETQYQHAAEFCAAIKKYLEEINDNS